jgi:hypothetical protein
MSIFSFFGDIASTVWDGVTWVAEKAAEGISAVVDVVGDIVDLAVSSIPGLGFVGDALNGFIDKVAA